MEKKAKALGGMLGKLMKYKYILLVLLLGLILITLPSAGAGGEEAAAARPVSRTEPEFSLSAEEDRLSETLAAIDGVGEVSVLLSLRGTVSRELAESGGEALVISQGSGSQAAVDLRYIYPEYLGAAVVCAGADDARVRLAVTEAVRSFTGLGADRITVIKMK